MVEMAADQPSWPLVPVARKVLLVSNTPLESASKKNDIDWTFWASVPKTWAESWLFMPATSAVEAVA